MEKSKFLKLGCPRCRKVSTVFGKASTKIKCCRCNYLLIKTQGGKAKVRAPVKEVLWN
jgi:ribosomal protein S27E